LIGLSPLCTAHPPTFQRWWVRTSIPFYRNFILAMHRSPGFGSTPGNLYALFRLAFATVTPEFGLALLPRSNSSDHYSIGTRSVHCIPKNTAFLPPLVGIRFQVLFHSPPGVLFTFPSRYLSTIGHRVVLSLAGWSRRIHTEFHVLRTTRETGQRKSTAFRLRGFHPLWRSFPSASTKQSICNFPA
jgi:hypothetical protein